jgi:hypothetical protein
MSNRRKTAGKSASRDAPLAVAFSASHYHVMAGIVLIALAAFIVYFPSITGGFILDDDGMLTENPLIKSSNGLYRFWFTAEAFDYWPVSNSALWLEWRLWGMNSTGYHVVNLL